MEIALLHVANCANLGLARDRITEAAQRVGLEVAIEEHLVRDESEAQRLGFTGSPTILVDGTDPFATADAPASVACRLYRTADGLQGAPTVEDLVEMLRTAGEPIACTLAPEALPERVAQWQALLHRASGRSSGADGTVRVELPDDVDLSELTRLVVAEQGCCAFLSFAITVDGRGTGLEVRAPEGADDIVAALFGAPA